MPEDTVCVCQPEDWLLDSTTPLEAAGLEEEEEQPLTSTEDGPAADAWSETAAECVPVVPFHAGRPTHSAKQPASTLCYIPSPVRVKNQCRAAAPVMSKGKFERSLVVMLSHA